MNLIVVVDRNWAIGKDGRQLVNIPADQQMFRNETTGKTVVMGRKTLESLPGKQPLSGRENIVLSRDPVLGVRNATVCGSFEETVELLKLRRSQDVFIIGGQSIYRQFLPLCDTAHVTWVDYAYDADTFFPDLDRNPEWSLEEESDEQTYFDLCYSFRRYVRKK